MALAREKAIAVGVVVLGGLSFLVYRQAKHDQELGTAAATPLPDVKSSDDVDKIELTNGAKPTIVLVKEGGAGADGGGGTWMLQSPHVEANQNNVKLLLDNAKELKAKEVVANSADDSLKASYELDPAHALHFVTYKGGEKKSDDWFGKSGGRGQMMMQDGKPQILAISGYSSYLYGRETKDWRNKDIFKFDDTNAASLTIDDKNGKFSCTKGDKWSCTFDGHAIPNFDDSKPADAVRGLKTLMADDFAAEGKTPADTGLDKPEGTISVALKDGAGTYTLKVGAVSTGTSRFAMKDGDSTIFVVSPNVSDWATASVTKFQKPVDAGAPAAAKTASAAKH